LAVIVTWAKAVALVTDCAERRPRLEVTALPTDVFTLRLAPEPEVTAGSVIVPAERAPEAGMAIAVFEAAVAPATADVPKTVPALGVEAMLPPPHAESVRRAPINGTK
jgi:hypothetical protein